MNFKQLLLIATACASIVTGISAHNAEIQEIADGVLAGDLKIGTTVLYDKAAWTLKAINISTDNDNENSSFNLTKPIMFANCNIGEEIIAVRCSDFQSNDDSNKQTYSANISHKNNYYYFSESDIRGFLRLHVGLTSIATSYGAILISAVLVGRMLRI